MRARALSLRSLMMKSDPPKIKQMESEEEDQEKSKLPEEKAKKKAKKTQGEEVEEKPKAVEEKAKKHPKSKKVIEEVHYAWVLISPFLLLLTSTFPPPLHSLSSFLLM